MKVSKINEFGRSMIEMLGVLAIIGVLSVGAIAGYQKAMMKYKLNKQAQQLNQVISVGLKYAGHWNFDEETALLPFFAKLNEFPKEMVSGDNQLLYDVFGTSMYYMYAPNAKWTNIFIHIKNQDDNFNLEICRNIIKTAKEYAPDVRSISAISGTEGSYDTSIAYYGNKYCQADTKCIKDLTLEKIDEICLNNIGNTYNPHLKIVYPE